jgi:quercetin dioxygenase-like cupin family protein
MQNRFGQIVYGLGVAAISLGSLAWVLQGQNATPNTKQNPNFQGTVNAVEDKYKTAYAHYKFEPGSRTKWHSHSGGQVILVEEGVTHFQNKGGPVMELKANEAYYAQPGVVHWHGATPTQSTTQFNTTRGDITWLEEVTDAQFNAKAVKAK